MPVRFRLLLAASFLPAQLALAQIPASNTSGSATTHISAHLPAQKDFHQFLTRDLIEHLTPSLGPGITVAYEMLRDAPTQTGIAYPKFYLWITATKTDNTIVEGAARVAAIEKKGFQITHFLSRSDIASHPLSIESVFPQTLLHSIRSKARLNK